MTFAVFVAGAAEGHALIEGDVVANDGGFSDDHARAVVDEHAAAEDGAGMDFDSGEEARALGEHPRDEAEFGSPEAVQ